MKYVHLLLLTGLASAVVSPAIAADNSFTLVAKHSGKCARVENRSHWLMASQSS